MYEHIVIFRFEQDPTDDQWRQLHELSNGLKRDIPGIIDLAFGQNISPRGQGFHAGLTVRFEDKASLDAYGPHPTHQALLTYLDTLGRADTVVIDFEVK